MSTRERFKKTYKSKKLEAKSKASLKERKIKLKMKTRAALNIFKKEILKNESINAIKDKKGMIKRYIAKDSDSISSISKSLSKKYGIGLNKVQKIILRINKKNPSLNASSRAAKGLPKINGLQKRNIKKGKKEIIWYTMFKGDEILIPSMKYVRRMMKHISEPKPKTVIRNKENKFQDMQEIYKKIFLKRIEEHPKYSKLDYENGEKNFISLILASANHNRHGGDNLLAKYDYLSIIDQMDGIKGDYAKMKDIKAELSGSFILYSYTINGNSYIGTFNLKKSNSLNYKNIKEEAEKEKKIRDLNKLSKQKLEKVKQIYINKGLSAIRDLVAIVGRKEAKKLKKKLSKIKGYLDFLKDYKVKYYHSIRIDYHKKDNLNELRGIKKSLMKAGRDSSPFVMDVLEDIENAIVFSLEAQRNIKMKKTKQKSAGITLEF